MKERSNYVIPSELEDKLGNFSENGYERGKQLQIPSESEGKLGNFIKCGYEKQELVYDTQ